MSAKLFNDPKPSQRTKPNQGSKRIDDLILDAELEAQDEINRKIRSEKIKMVVLVLLGVGLFYALNTGIQNKTIPVPAFLEEDSQVAQAPVPAPETTGAVPGEAAPQPIPFPLPAATPGEAPATPAGDSSSKLENEVLSMLQSNMKGSARPAVPQAPSQVKPAEPPASPEASVEAPEEPADPEAENEAAAATEPEIPAVKPATPVTAKAPQVRSRKTLTAEDSQYLIQVGAYAVKANADRVIKRLMSSGYSPLVQTQTSRSSMYVVFIGGFADEESPQNMMSALKQKGLNPQLNKNDNGSYSIVLGKEKTSERAEALKQKLTRMGIFTSMKQMKINSQVYIVRVGGFDSGNSARSNQKRIEQMGYTGTIIRRNS